MESIDLQGLLEWAHDLVEQRWSKLAAWVVTLALFGAFTAAVIWLLFRLV